MSETAPEAPARLGGGNPLTRKLGPLPLWGWLGIATALALVYVFVTKKKTASSGTTTGAGTAAGATSVNSPGGVDASLVPQFVNQTYVESTPPVTNITDSGNTNSPVNSGSGTQTNNPPATGTATTPPPTTISGAPGSYTTNLPGNYDEWTSTGGYSINTVAKSHGLTAQQLIAASESQTSNPNLAAYVKKGNLNAPLPNGIALFIPKANWGVKIKT